jgi:hypothetical protein
LKRDVKNGQKHGTSANTTRGRYFMQIELTHPTTCRKVVNCCGKCSRDRCGSRHKAERIVSRGRSRPARCSLGSPTLHLLW